MQDIGIGVIGAGNISTIYLTNMPRIPGAEVRGIADMRPEVAAAQGRRFGVRALSVDALLARDDIQIVVNLTVPSAHAPVSMAALSAGKHVFSEKPLATDVDLGRRVVQDAEARGLMLGCAPDTFLGAGGRLSRQLIDAGALGKVLSGTAFVLSHGMEHWHPDPIFFFKPGGGPVLDLGPYYITALVNLLGPVARVFAMTGAGFPERLVTAEGPRKGHRIAVETPTSALSLLEFAAGAHIVFGASWDVWKHSHPSIELYGTEGSLRVPDPNFFGGAVEIADKGGDWIVHETSSLPLGAINWPDEAPRFANHRALGVADMAAAIRGGRPNHASGRLALHTLEIMDAILRSGATGTAIAIRDAAERPPPLPEAEAARLFAA